MTQVICKNIHCKYNTKQGIDDNNHTEDESKNMCGKPDITLYFYLTNVGTTVMACLYDIIKTNTTEEENSPAYK
jgi:hypothetical protein